VLGETKEKLRARDTNGDGVIVDTERRSTMTAAEKSLMSFAEVCKNLKVSDFKIPKATEWQPPPFSWSGTPAKVAQSLLDHCSNPANDNRWPRWGTPTDHPSRASRYVLDTAEAQAMVEALKPLYVSRQKAVLTEIAKRTDSRDYGCVSPTDAGKRVLQAFARELGVSLTFKQPRGTGHAQPLTGNSAVGGNHAPHHVHHIQRGELHVQDVGAGLPADQRCVKIHGIGAHVPHSRIDAYFQPAPDPLRHTPRGEVVPVQQVHVLTLAHTLRRADDVVDARVEHGALQPRGPHRLARLPG
jgi:hypothetical protein